MDIQKSTTSANQALVPKEILDKIDAFIKELNKPIPGGVVKKNKSTGRDYAPIGYIEYMLDRHFKGLWSREVIREGVMIDSIYATVRLRVFFPGFGYVTRDGVGAVPIQLSKGSGRTETQNIVPGAIQKNLPAALSFAFHNAAKTLGRSYGRDMGRNDWGQYDYQADENVTGIYSDELTYNTSDDEQA
jgi:hypothetical protein